MRTSRGTFINHNKVLPEAYINFVSHPRAMATLGVRGIVAGLLTDPELVAIRELFLGARTLKYYRPAGGTKANATVGDLTIEALYPGTRGNEIKIIIEVDLGDENAY